MNTDLIADVLKTAGYDDETKIEEISIKLESLYGEEVQGLIQNRDEIKEEKKTLQARFNELDTSFKDTKSKLEKYSSIPDPTAALNALEAVKNANLERDVDKEVQEAVQERTRTLIEESTQAKNELERIQREKEEQAELFKKKSRDQSFENQITMAAVANNIDEKLMDEYRFNIRKVFNEYDEDSQRYIAKDSEGKQMFGKKQTTKLVDIDLYTNDYLIAEKPFFLKGNTSNPSMGGNLNDGPDHSELFYMRGNFAKPTEKGYEFMNENGNEKFEIEKSKFEKKAQSQKAA